MRKPNSVEFANAFMWLTVLAASVVLFSDSDKLWMLIVAVVVCGSTSMSVVSKGCRKSD